MHYSRAQNFEDAVLWRVFSDLQTGFYIDVGANDPVSDSVTKVFYDAGWSGINIEPVDEYYQLLCESRPRDTNLRYCASNEDGAVVEIAVVPHTGLSTAVASVSEVLHDHNYEFTRRHVDTVRLETLWRKYNPEEVHFLKIDVEGMEQQVLEGMDLEFQRPWIILVEAVTPITGLPNYGQWESRLIGNRYRYIYTDGINRFYLAEEHHDLAARFDHPPNVSDELLIPILHMRNSYDQDSREREALNEELAYLRENIDRKDALIGELNSRMRQVDDYRQVLEKKLDDIVASKIWRYTSPLRKAGPWMAMQVARSRKIGTLLKDSNEYIKAFGFSAFARKAVQTGRMIVSHSILRHGASVAAGELECLTEGEKKLFRLLRSGTKVENSH